MNLNLLQNNCIFFFPNKWYMSFNDINPYFEDYPVYSKTQRGYGHNIIKNNSKFDNNDIDNNDIDNNDSDNNNKQFKTLDDIKELYQELDEKKQKEEIISIKEKILRTLGHVQQIAKVTQQELDSQGEIITDMKPGLEHIENNLDKSEATIDILKNRFNKFAFWKGWTLQKSTITTLPSQIKRDLHINNINAKSELNEKNQKQLDKYNKLKEPEEVKQPNTSDGILSLLWTNRDIKDKTEDEFYDVLSESLKKIRQQNGEIGKELDAQNKTLRQMTKCVHNNNKQIEDVNRNINRLIP